MTHYRAFMDAVPFPALTRHDGHLNLAAHWPINRSPPLELLKPDLGSAWSLLYRVDRHTHFMTYHCQDPRCIWPRPIWTKLDPPQFI